MKRDAASLPPPLPTSVPTPLPSAEADQDDAQRQAPIYALIGDVLRKALAEGSIPPGLVLLEGPLAQLLHSTRTPVRQALRELEEQGLVSRFDGRGFLAGPPGVAPQRMPLDAAMLGLASAEPVRKTLGWEAIYDAVERDVVHLSVFDRYRLNELELARHFKVGRTVARDVLLRLESLGLVEKDERLRWSVTPLDARRINHLYELRWLLEPAALAAALAAHTVDQTTDELAGQLVSMKEDLRRSIKAYPDISRQALDKLEHDLHVGFLSRCPNHELLHGLQRTRCVLTLSKHTLGEAAPMPRRDPFMAEHLAIVEAVAQADVAEAQNQLRKHLESSCVKVTQRVELVRSRAAMPQLPYVG